MKYAGRMYWPYAAHTINGQATVSKSGVARTITAGYYQEPLFTSCDPTLLDTLLRAKRYTWFKHMTCWRPERPLAY